MQAPPPGKAVVRIASFAFAALLATPSARADVPEHVPVNNAFYLSSHNTYHYDGVKAGLTVGASLASSAAVAIEWDINDDYVTGNRKWMVPRDWYVSHEVRDPAATGYCTTTGMLSDCLSALRAWQVANPGHRPIWVFIDKKQGWNGTDRRPADLDNLIASQFPEGDVFRPLDLYASTGRASPRAAAGAWEWPSFGALRGKIVFVLTGNNRQLSSYADARRAGAWAFVAPTATEAGHVTGIPSGFTSGTVEWVAMYNFEWNSPSNSDRCSTDRCAQLTLASGHGYLTRVWDVDDAGEYAAAVAARAHFIAVDDTRLRWHFPETGPHP